MSHYQRLTINHREIILESLVQSKTIREIARKLNGIRIKISENIHLIKHRMIINFPKVGVDIKQGLLKIHPCFKQIKHLFLDCQWLPEEIAQRLLLETGETIIRFINIYRGVYADPFDKQGLSQGYRGAIRKLRHRDNTRHNKSYVEKQGKIPITNTIHERPEAANKKAELCHWEADTVTGKIGQSCLVTFC
ncbi:hypothetical protein LB941_11490 [Ligilactobacillus sp. WILCCON 0076]|uniref:Transposase n=1 Tax=Ligilactobacillus ubinensis TaxID=2876789 RepID=A0A9X2JMJ3_9LACO|nr:hypothetical protein [Ligilactobacillus ubinensis]MCP0887954.1 hypothetical protein [Ligilactobacillus ubinensis]